MDNKLPSATEIERLFHQNNIENQQREAEKAKAKAQTERDRKAAEKARRKKPVMRPISHCQPRFKGMTDEAIEKILDAEYAQVPVATRRGAPVRPLKPLFTGAAHAKAGSKTARLLAAISRPGGATMTEICEASGFDERNAKTTMNILKAKQSAKIVTYSPGASSDAVGVRYELLKAVA